MRRLGYNIYNEPNQEITKTGLEKRPNNIADDSNGQEEKSRDPKSDIVKVSFVKTAKFDKCVQIIDST